MSIQQLLENVAWCKSDWELPTRTKEMKKLFRLSISLPELLSVEVDDVIEKSNSFPIPFPIETVRLQTLMKTRPVEKLKTNIESTYVLVHERALLLMANFLVFKREYGSSIEKAFYKGMKLTKLIDRLLEKRAVTFMGPSDKYLLMTGEKGKEGWEAVGTEEERSPLVLEQCLSYDEMKLAALLYVSGHTECINAGARHNSGRPEEPIQEHAVIIGTIGPRFKRKERMDFEDILITEEQNTEDKGFGEDAPKSERTMWRQMWAEFYGVQSYTYKDLTSTVNIPNKSNKISAYTDRYLKLARTNQMFDNEVYYKRIAILVDSMLLEADHRANEEGRDAFLNVIGCGLGVWRASPHQNDVYVLVLLKRVRELLHAGALKHVTDVNLAYIRTSDSIAKLFTSSSQSVPESPIVKKTFIASEKHPKGGVNVQTQDREPSAPLSAEHANKLLVLTYAWDGNAHPGNEFWIGKLTSSGDPAAACSTQVSELHNAHINPVLRARHAKVVTRDSLVRFGDYCARASM